MDDDAEQLRERVDKLEQIAASQQETIEELENQSLLGSWGRRGVLGGIAAALGMASASGSAAAGVGDVGTPSSRVDVFADTLEATNQSKAELSLSSNKTGVTAGTKTNLVDTTDKDIGGIVNASNEIVPNQDGKFQFEAFAFLSNGTSNDRIVMDIFNVSDSNRILQIEDSTSAASQGTLNLSLSVDLIAGKSYVVRVSNFDSSFDLESSEEFSELEVYRRVNQS